MVRFARVVAPGIAHHITQRGNTRRFILEGDTEKSIYLDLLHRGIERYGMALIGYWLMSNKLLTAAPLSNHFRRVQHFLLQIRIYMVRPLTLEENPQG